MAYSSDQHVTNNFLSDNHPLSEKGKLPHRQSPDDNSQPDHCQQRELTVSKVSGGGGGLNCPGIVLA